mmetsp:Transcript_52651/g.170004  ORF Transcript_52651/g.170004 Transcript_52651/m.170004 type:complete len:274 (+) Transcript_52651:3-824(+)
MAPTPIADLGPHSPPLSPECPRTPNAGQVPDVPHAPLMSLWDPWEALTVELPPPLPPPAEPPQLALDPEDDSLHVVVAVVKRRRLNAKTPPQSSWDTRCASRDCKQPRVVQEARNLRPWCGKRVCCLCYQRLRRTTIDLSVSTQEGFIEELVRKFGLISKDTSSMMRHPDERQQLYRDIAIGLQGPEQSLDMRLPQATALLSRHGLRVKVEKLKQAVAELSAGNPYQAAFIGRRRLVTDEQMHDVLMFVLSAADAGNAVGKDMIKASLCKFFL